MSDIPFGWRRSCLAELAIIFNGKANGTGDGHLRVFKTRHVYDGYLRLADPAFVSRDRAAKVPDSTHLRAGDTLTPNMAHGTIGRVAFVRDAEANWTVDGQITVIRPKDDAVLGRYLYDWLSRQESKRQLIGMEKGGAFDELRGQTHIYRSDVGTIAVLVPPLPEQEKIAAILSSVDDAIEATQAVIDQLRTVKKAVANDLLTGGVPGPHRKSSTRQAWGSVGLGDAGEWLSGGTPSKQDRSLWAGPIPWVSPKDMKRPRICDAIDHVSEAALDRGTRLAPVGSVLMVVRGMILAHSFPVAVTTASVAFNQDIKALRPSSDFDSEFLLYSLQRLGAQILSTAEVANHGTKRIPSDLLFAIPVQCPPLEEQRAIANILRSFDAREDSEGEFLRGLREARSALISVLLTGEVRVKPDEDAQ